MGYLEETLIFESNKIYFTDEVFGGDREVMMDWEDSLMSASAAYICEGGGDILEIGFGMGISAGYMHSHSINSHTIIENHPQIITKAQEWASGTISGQAGLLVHSKSSAVGADAQGDVVYFGGG